jgi:hypothetical protein
MVNFVLLAAAAVLYPECLTGHQGILPHSMKPVWSLQLQIERDQQVLLSFP